MTRASKTDEKLDKVLEFAARMDERHNALVEKVERVAQGVDKINSRVTKLESWRSKTIGYGAASATALSFLTHYIMQIVKRPQ